MDIKTVMITGNGNLSFKNFQTYYAGYIDRFLILGYNFVLSDFRGTDVLAQEYLKDKTEKVTIYKNHGFLADKYKTYVEKWKIIEGFDSNTKRDTAMINVCDIVIGKDFNSDENRKSGTLKAIELAIKLNKIILPKPHN